MIFATVGTQLPFDRLIDTLDNWKLSHCNKNVFAQIGKSGQRPNHIDFVKTMSVSQFDKAVAKCNVVVAHAGMGSVLTALKARKPLIIMPRRSSFGEHRNDHQLATARKLSGLPGIQVAMDTDDLIRQLNAPRSLVGESTLSAFASPTLLTAVREFIHGPQEIYV